MLISCPKCNAIYDVNDGLLPAEGKKLRCARCGTIWLAKPEDAIEPSERRDDDLVVKQSEPNVLQQQDVIETTEHQIVAEELPQAQDSIPVMDEPVVEPNVQAEENDQPAPSPIETQQKSSPLEPKPIERDPNEIFSRLAEQTKSIFKEEPELANSKIKSSGLMSFLGLDDKSNRMLCYLVFCLILFLSMFYARYEIVRNLPFMGKVYAAIGIRATIPGYGLEFQNVTRREFEEDYVRKFEIKGFVANTSNFVVEVPTISIEMLDNDTNVLQTVETTTPVAKLAPEGRISFRAIVVKPSSFTNYILITFIDAKK